MSHAHRLLAAALVVLAAGCAPVEPFRTQMAECKVPGDASPDARAACAHNAVETYDGFVVSYVELTDMGLFHDRRQLDAALRQVDPAVVGQPVDVVVYVHGWKHSAEYDDRDIADFSRDVMRHLAPQGTGRKTVGIYVGWRGTPVTLPLVRDLTFYDRKGAADHIARGSVRELLSRLRAIKQDAAPQSFSVTVVGHSFGGLILFNAISGSVMDAMTQAEWGGMADGKPLPQLFDLAILLNPAFEGVRYEPLFQAAVYGVDRQLQRTRWPTDTAPVLVSITSAADAATRTAFPVGRAINSLLQHEGRTDQDGGEAARGDWVEKVGNRNALGHIARYRTHTLAWDARTGVATCKPAGNPLVPQPDGFPLWNLYTDAPFITSHSDIFNRHLWNYVALLRRHVVDKQPWACPSGDVGTE